MFNVDSDCVQHSNDSPGIEGTPVGEDLPIKALKRASFSERLPHKCLFRGCHRDTDHSPKSLPGPKDHVIVQALSDRHPAFDYFLVTSKKIAVAILQTTKEIQTLVWC